jgi:ZIP family zinc transporter
VFGACSVTTGAFLLPYAMGFAAGVMRFLISHEIVPPAHGRGDEHVATAGLLDGLPVMRYLGVVLAA